MLTKIIKELSPFIYLPNLGNYGDLLIHEAVRQLFQKLGVDYRLYNPDDLPDKFNLVFCGAGLLIPQWINHFNIDILTDKRIEQCVFLPFSSTGLEDFYQKLDKRFHLFCRDEATYYRMTKLTNGASCYLHDDMAISLDLQQVDKDCIDLSDFNLDVIHSDEARLAYQQLTNNFGKKLIDNVRRSSTTAAMDGYTKRIAFLLRKDAEKETALDTLNTFDISTEWMTTGYDMPFHANMIKCFADAVKTVDVVVTDRLHVAIMAWHSGREVYMLDNSYKKLSGVYELSLKHDAKVHLLEDGRLTPELDAAWARFNLKKTVNSCHLLLKNQEQQLAANAMALSSLQEHTQSLQVRIQSLQEELRILRLKQSYGKMKKRMLYCRIMSKLSFGKKKHKYAAEKRKLKALIAEARKAEYM